MYYRKIESKIKNCNLCSFGDEPINKKLGHTYGYGGSSVMIVALAPSYIRDKSPYPLSRDYEKLTVGTLFKVLDEINWPVDKTYFTNILKCSTSDKNRVPEDSEMDTCFNTYFLQEYYLVNPKIVVSLGKKVYDYLEKKGTNNLYPIEHFSYINRDMKNKYSEWKNKWIKILENLNE